ncbi:MAG: branched-chain amino acid aminotransferase [Planctomycetota bacterium]
MASSFGSVFCGTQAVARYREGAWSPAVLEPLAPLALHPGAHGLHYGSSCFEGLKAYRHADGSVHVFRLDRHVARMQASADVLCLPKPGTEQLTEMVLSVVDAVRDEIPALPGALYIRPLLLGTLESVGAAGSPSTDAMLVVMTCPVGDYFAGGIRPLRIALEERRGRAAPGFGCVKTGSNYAAALRPVLHAKKAWKADQVLFCPDGDVQETGAANFLLIQEGAVHTKPLDDTILHGITRASVLELAPSLGLRVDESPLTVDELMSRSTDAEAALSGTAAVLTPVGTLIRGGYDHAVGNGQMGPVTKKLRESLLAIQSGEAPDTFGWLRRV